MGIYNVHSSILFIMFTLLPGAARDPGHGTRFMRGKSVKGTLLYYSSSQLTVVTNSSALLCSELG